MTLTDISIAAPVPRAAQLQDLSAREIARRIAAGDLSSSETVEHFIARLKTVNGKLNAVAVDLFESEREAAATSTKALARGGKLGPLAGLPVTIKECFDLAGDIRPAVSPRYHRTPRRSLCRGAARGRRDPDRQDQPAAAHDLHGDRQSAVRTHQQSVGSGEVLRRQQRRRSRRYRRRRVDAAGLGNDICGAADNRGLLAGSARSSRPRDAYPTIVAMGCRSGSERSERRPDRWRGMWKT